jgi:hypothetical protein
MATHTWGSTTGIGGFNQAYHFHAFASSGLSGDGEVTARVVLQRIDILINGQIVESFGGFQPDDQGRYFSRLVSPVPEPSAFVTVAFLIVCMLTVTRIRHETCFLPSLPNRCHQNRFQ